MAPQLIENARSGLGNGARPLSPKLAKGGRLQLSLRGLWPKACAQVAFRAGFVVAFSGFTVFNEASALRPPLAFTSAA